MSSLASPQPNCFALLDDSTSNASEPRSRLYTRLVDTLSCHDAEGWPAVLDSMQQALQKGLYAVGLFSYELGTEMLGTAQRALGQPLAQVLLFEQCQRLPAADVDAWLNARRDADTGSNQAGILDLQASVTEAEFSAALARIHEYIAAGDTYQVNYTYRLHFKTYGSLLALYQRLRARQPVPYGALIALPDGGAVLSMSPELFVRHAQRTLTVRPMKGTAPATGNIEEDTRRAAALASDPKNRAENLMIVDLLRNDLGCIAALGTVQVVTLFDVTRFSSVLQMTSTVQARLRDDVTLPDIFNALYPCGSITGAPKRRTMQIIRELETEPRGLYTGAIGWFDPPAPDERIGDFCLSVPIRTMELQAPDEYGVRTGKMGVGAGIVYDSDAASEYAECQLKARFLTGLRHEFQLFETMHATHAEGCRHLDRHLQRLRASAQHFGFSCDEIRIRETVRDACAALPAGPHRLRLTLDQAGICTVQTAPLAPLTEPVRLLLAPRPASINNVFLQHKSTVREYYDAAWRAAEAEGAFDTLFFNAEGELTEGGRSNVFIKLNGRWYTPPLAVGVLPGVMRAVLLDDPLWQASERRLTLADLYAAEQVVVCNALRGVLAAVVDQH